jgi:hypothetical protein
VATGGGRRAEPCPAPPLPTGAAARRWLSRRHDRATHRAVRANSPERPFNSSEASTDSLPPPPLRLLPAGTTRRRVGLSPTGNRQLCTAHGCIITTSGEPHDREELHSIARHTSRLDDAPSRKRQGGRATRTRHRFHTSPANSVRGTGSSPLPSRSGPDSVWRDGFFGRDRVAVARRPLSPWYRRISARLCAPGGPSGRRPRPRAALRSTWTAGRQRRSP